jgi:hypothetical protein
MFEICFKYVLERCCLSNSEIYVGYVLYINNSLVNIAFKYILNSFDILYYLKVGVAAPIGAHSFPYVY